MSEIHALFIIGFTAVLAPLLARLPALIRTPVVVLELVLGILIGPSGAGWVTSHGAIGFLGEFGLIDLIKDTVQLKNPGSLEGIGDDAAVIDNKLLTVVTTDLLLENIHFDLSYCPLKHLGYKAVVVNVSDIYAMNAQPKQIVVGLGLSNRFSLDALEELYEGIRLACDMYGVDLVGGDTSSSASGLVISVTAIGAAEKDDLVYRDGAKETDLICVTGDLGAAYLGLQLLNREKQVYLENPKMQPDFAGYDYLLERQLKPEAQKETIELLKEIGVNGPLYLPLYSPFY